MKKENTFPNICYVSFTESASILTDCHSMYCAHDVRIRVHLGRNDDQAMQQLADKAAREIAIDDEMFLNY